MVEEPRRSSDVGHCNLSSSGSFLVARMSDISDHDNSAFYSEWAYLRPFVRLRPNVCISERLAVGRERTGERNSESEKTEGTIILCATGFIYR